MKKTLLSALVSSLIFTGIATADSSKALTKSEVSTKVMKAETKKAQDKKVKLVQEALTSLKLAAKALQNLEQNKSDEAKKNIELALGKLEAILTAKDSPKLLPIENRMIVKNFTGTAKDVEIAVERVKKLLDIGRVQEARVLLSTLQSEINLVVVNLPLVSYPDALKLASKYIIEEKPEKAKEVLRVALSTFTEIEHIIPIPLVNSIELVSTASHIAKDDKEQALKYLQFASEELDKAEKLGYISRSTTTYAQLHEMIKKIEKEVKGPNKAEKLFQELGEKLKEFKNKIFSSSEKENEKK